MTLSVIGMACTSLIDRCANSGTKLGSSGMSTGGVGRDGTGSLSTGYWLVALNASDSARTESSRCTTLRTILEICFEEW